MGGSETSSHPAGLQGIQFYLGRQQERWRAHHRGADDAQWRDNRSVRALSRHREQLSRRGRRRLCSLHWGRRSTHRRLRRRCALRVFWGQQPDRPRLRRPHQQNELICKALSAYLPFVISPLRPYLFEHDLFRKPVPTFRECSRLAYQQGPVMTLLLTHQACLDHLTPPGHPERPDRLRALEQVVAQDKFNALVGDTAPEGNLDQGTLCHGEHYVTELRHIAPTSGMIYIDGDTSMSPGTWEAVMRGVGGAVSATDAVMSGKHPNAFV